MSDEEIQTFCGDICLAAAKFGIMIHESNPTPEGTMFQWYDPAPGLLIKGVFDKDRKKSLFLACENLVHFLNRPMK